MVDRLVAQCIEKLIAVIENEYLKSPYVKQKSLMDETEISYPFLNKLEARGLKRVKLDDKDKTVFLQKKVQLSKVNMVFEKTLNLFS